MENPTFFVKTSLILVQEFIFLCTSETSNRTTEKSRGLLLKMHLFAVSLANAKITRTQILRHNFTIWKCVLSKNIKLNVYRMLTGLFWFKVFDVLNTSMWVDIFSRIFLHRKLWDGGIAKMQFWPRNGETPRRVYDPKNSGRSVEV